MVESQVLVLLVIRFSSVILLRIITNKLEDLIATYFAFKAHSARLVNAKWQRKLI